MCTIYDTLRYDGKLAAEKQATLRLKGENGIMKKKFLALQRDIEDQREDIKSLLDCEQRLYDKIKGLEKDIQGHKKEINEREETIQVMRVNHTYTLYYYMPYFTIFTPLPPPTPSQVYTPRYIHIYTTCTPYKHLLCIYLHPPLCTYVYNLFTHHPRIRRNGSTT